jgi:hypothetical protein
MLANGKPPWLSGSGKLATPLLRMQEENASIAVAAAASCAGVRGRGPPRGMYFWQAPWAD